jgi:AcrR family transcriptional regulator
LTGFEEIDKIILNKRLVTKSETRFFQMKERIIQQAALLFTKRGYRGISMRNLAEACEITQAALYYHFRNKETILEVILQNYCDETGLAIDSIRAQNISLTEQLTQIVVMLFNQRPDQRSVIRLSMLEIDNLNFEKRSAIARLYQERFTGQIEAILKKGIDCGEFRPVPVATYIWILQGMLFPFLTMQGQISGISNQREAALIVVEAFLKGVRAGGLS